LDIGGGLPATSGIMERRADWFVMPDRPIMAPLIGGQSNAEEIRRGQRIERPHDLSSGAHQHDCFASTGHGNCRGTRFPGGCLLARTSNKGSGGVIWGIPIQIRRNRYG
jgi:hypothetical protein